MNYPIINDIFYGEKAQFDQIKHSKEYFDLINVIEEYDSKLRKLLPENLIELYEKTNSAIEDLNDLDTDEHFAEGFRTGLLLGAEVFRDK